MPYKAGIIGCGGIAGSERRNYVHAEAYERHPDTELVAVQDMNFEKQRDFIARWNVPQTKIEDVEIVSICTPDEEHINCLKQCLEFPKLKAVWCEKPISRNAQEAFDITHEYEVAGKTLCVNYQRRWAEKFQIPREDIKGVSVKYTNSLWRNGCHGVDLILYLLGLPRAIENITRQKDLVSADLHYGDVIAHLRGLDSTEFLFDVKISHTDGMAEAVNEWYDFCPVLDGIVNNNILSDGLSAAWTTQACQWLMELS